MKFLITTPHVVCVSFLRDCDIYAQRSAELISKELSRMGHITVTIYGDIHRSVVDLNRRSSRGTNFRKTIEMIVDTFRPDFVLDVHSFPVTTRGFSQPVTFISDWVPSDFVVRIANRMGAPILEGKTNDIIDLAKEKGVDAVLVEFVEAPESQKAVARLSEVIDESSSLKEGY